MGNRNQKMLGLRIPPVVDWSAGGEPYWYFLDFSSFKKTLVVCQLLVARFMQHATHIALEHLLCVRSGPFLRHITCLEAAVCEHEFRGRRVARVAHSCCCCWSRWPLGRVPLAVSMLINLRHISAVHKCWHFFFWPMFSTPTYGFKELQVHSFSFLRFLYG